MKIMLFFWMSQLIFDEKPLKNHDFWIFMVTKNAKIVIFDWFLCKNSFLEFCPISFLLKNQWKWWFCNSEFSKITKTLIFQCFFAKNENFDKFTSRWSEKKIFRSGSDGPNIVFDTLLWHAAIKIWGRLIEFSHFWWFDFLIF